EFAAISAVALRHNAISQTLSTAPDQLEPIHRRKPNRDIDARPWSRGFYAAMNLRLPAWAQLLNTESTNPGRSLPILLYCVHNHSATHHIRLYVSPLRQRVNRAATHARIWVAYQILRVLFSMALLSHFPFQVQSDSQITL